MIGWSITQRHFVCCTTCRHLAGCTLRRKTVTWRHFSAVGSSYLSQSQESIKDAHVTLTDETITSFSIPFTRCLPRFVLNRLVISELRSTRAQSAILIKLQVIPFVFVTITGSNRHFTPIVLYCTIIGPETNISIFPCFYIYYIELMPSLLDRILLVVFGNLRYAAPPLTCSSN